MEVVCQSPVRSYVPSSFQVARNGQSRSFTAPNNKAYFQPTISNSKHYSQTPTPQRFLKTTAFGIAFICAQNALGSRFWKAFLGPPSSCLFHKRGTRRTYVGGPVRSLAKDQGGSQREPELEVAVFRFTLGIPGVEDALLPRILGCLVGALLLGNHLATPSPVADAQLRSEALGVVLALLACIVPYLSRRLQEGKGGRRAKSAVQDGTTREVFVLDPGLSPGLKQQLAWTTYSLLKNTRTRTVVISDGLRVLCVRGAVSVSVPQASLLDALADAINLGKDRANLMEKRYLPDKGSLSSAGVDKWSFAPTNTSAAFFQPVPAPENGFMVLLSDENRFVSTKERIWIEGLASRLFASDTRNDPETGHQKTAPD